ncbi:PAAR domain-containing protein [Vibrio brasiliensis]
MFNNAVTVGTPTSKGGKVLTGTAGVKINNLDVSLLGDQATCTCGDENCRGVGPIIQGCPRNIKIGDRSSTSPSSSFPSSASHLSQVNDPYRSEPLLFSQTQTIDKILSDSLALECSLEDEMAKNMQRVLITDLEDAHKILHNLWLEAGKDVAALAASINTAKSWFSHTRPLFDAASIAKQFGDMGVKADLVESKGKTFVAFNGTDQNGRVLKYAFVNGTRINMNGKKYPLNSFKAMQAGFSPKSRAANFKGAGVLTFVVSASIATSDLVFKDDYHLVKWFGNVGSDMFKALVQFGAGEAALWVAATLSGHVIIGAVVVFATYAVIEWAWGEFNVAKKVVTGVENAIESEG